MIQTMRAKTVSIRYLLIIPLFLVVSSCGTTKFSSSPNSIPLPQVDDIHIPYSYRGQVIDVYDGDTFTVSLDMGLGIQCEKVIRLARVDTPELRGSEREQGLVVRDYVSWISKDRTVYAKTDRDKDGKYGRLLAEIYIQTDTALVNLSDHLLQKNYARLYGN